MIIYKKGDLLESDADIIAHGCNAVGGFGSGVAGQIAKRYPRVKNAYMLRHREGGHELGEVQFVYAEPGSGQYIANCITQFNYLPRGVCHADYEAIRTAMTRVKNWAKPKNWSIAIPKIGAGLAGGDWKIIEDILEEVFEDYEVTVYTLD